MAFWADGGSLYSRAAFPRFWPAVEGKRRELNLLLAECHMASNNVEDTHSFDAQGDLPCVFRRKS